ncbi:hypothetical protein OUZ56_021907 [Daphnia magna]|uniref:Uncharacterized protein n=1 Tax=Daphnia magna TaxID=35525 RepID=A0ABR0AUT1_9CRUS|nr:hypothetical protein OUZ56_021907 [Daphnia magna]
MARNSMAQGVHKSCESCDGHGQCVTQMSIRVGQGTAGKQYELFNSFATIDFINGIMPPLLFSEFALSSFFRSVRHNVRFGSTIIELTR